MEKILIANLTGSTVSVETFKSIYGLQIPEGYITSYDCVKGYDCAQARNKICQEALDYEFDYVLMADSDMILPEDTLIRLLSHNLPIVYAWTKKQSNTIEEYTEIFKLSDGNNYDTRYLINELPKDTLLEVKGCGMGCVLIKCSLLKEIKDDRGLWFKFIQYNKDENLSEDLYFCGLLKCNNYKIYVDTAVRCGHIKEFVI